MSALDQVISKFDSNSIDNVNINDDADNNNNQQKISKHSKLSINNDYVLNNDNSSTSTNSASRFSHNSFPLIHSKSTLSSVSHFNELTDCQLCAIPFDKCISSYETTDYMQNNYNTVLSVDRTVLGDLKANKQKESTSTNNYQQALKQRQQLQFTSNKKRSLKFKNKSKISSKLFMRESMEKWNNHIRSMTPTTATTTTPISSPTASVTIPLNSYSNQQTKVLFQESQNILNVDHQDLLIFESQNEVIMEVEKNKKNGFQGQNSSITSYLPPLSSPPSQSQSSSSMFFNEFDNPVILILNNSIPPQPPIPTAFCEQQKISLQQDVEKVDEIEHLQEENQKVYKITSNLEYNKRSYDHFHEDDNTGEVKVKKKIKLNLDDLDDLDDDKNNTAITNNNSQISKILKIHENY